MTVALVLGPAMVKMLSGYFKFKYRRKLAAAINADINKQSPYIESIRAKVEGSKVFNSFKEYVAQDLRFEAENRKYPRLLFALAFSL